MTATAASAHAHPVPALAPDFGAPECITVVDKRSEPQISLDYLVGYDDVMEEPDHIPVADQKTHQFFAFRGQLTASDPVYTYAPFDPALEPDIALPMWINQTDLQACAAKNTPMIAPQFTPEGIGANTLSERPDMMGQWLNVREMRVPITERQGMLGLRWMLADVPPGVYQAAAYIYSPPFNAWEPRPGVIKVVDGTRDVPAVTMSSVDASLFEGQGRKVGGCVNAPPGTQLQAYARATETPNAPWEMWDSKPADDTGRFEFCYRSPKPGFSGIMELRVVAVSPEGDMTAAYAPDQIVLIPTASTCTPSAKLCCDIAAAGGADTGAAATSVDPGASAPPPVGTLAQPTMTAAAGAGAAGAPAQTMEPAMTRAPAADSGGGCSVGGGADSGWPLLLLMAAWLWLRRRG